MYTPCGECKPQEPQLEDVLEQSVCTLSHATCNLSLVIIRPIGPIVQLSQSSVMTVSTCFVAHRCPPIRPALRRAASPTAPKSPPSLLCFEACCYSETMQGLCECLSIDARLGCATCMLMPPNKAMQMVVILDTSY